MLWVFALSELNLALGGAKLLSLSVDIFFFWMLPKLLFLPKAALPWLGQKGIAVWNYSGNALYWWISAFMLCKMEMCSIL